MKPKDPCVYILSSKNNTVLYIGVTTDLERRIGEHKSHLIPGFSQKYFTDKLVYVERCISIEDAISREKQLKKWRREKKDALIASLNPNWKDLSEE